MRSKGFNPCLLALVLTVLGSCTSGKKGLKNTALIQAAPLQSALIIETSNLKEAYTTLEGSALWKSLKGLQLRRALEEKRAQLRAVLRASKGHIRADERFLICAEDKGVNSAAFTFYTFAPGLQLSSLAKNLSGQYRFSSYVYNGSKLFSGEPKGKASPLYFSRYGDLFFFSNAKLLVEEGIRQLRSNTSLLEQPDFKFLYQTKSNSAQANIFIQLQESNTLLRDWFRRYANPRWQALANWAALDLNIEEAQCDLSGVLQLKDHSPQFLGLFKEAPARANYAKRLIPNNAAAYLFYAIADYPTYYQKLKRYWNQKNELKRKRQKLQQWGINPEARFSWVKHGFVNFYTFDKGAVENNLILPAEDPDEALKKLADQSKAFQSYRGYRLFQLKNPKLLDYAFGAAFSIAHPYYFAAKDGLVFSGNAAVLKNLINQLISHSTLGNSDEILKFREAFATECQVFLFAQNPAALQFIARLLPKKAARKLRRHKGLKKMQFFGLQLTFNGEQAVLTALLKNSQRENKNIEARWTLQLEAPVARGPFGFTNYKTHRRQIALQDEKNNLYLIDAKGAVLWKKKLPEKIMGGIHEMDMYKNGKIQLVFNTASRLYVIGRDGQIVKPFPITLKKQASAPMGCFDYERNRRYRLLIPEGKNFELYDQLGKAVQGFHFQAVKGYINTTPQHARIGTKDYITTTTNTGKVLILYRNGRVRVNVPKTYPLSGQPLRFLQGDSAGWVTSTRAGALLSFYPDGKTKRAAVNLRAEQRFEVVGAGVVFLSGRSLKRLGKGGFRHQTTNNPAYLSTAELRGQAYYALTDRVTKQLYLIDKRGRTVSGFPVYGDGRALILDSDGDSDPEVVVSTTSGRLIMYGS